MTPWKNYFILAFQGYLSTLLSLREKFLYSELFCPVFSGIRTEYGKIRSISPYSVQMRENADRNNSEYGHFLRSVGNFRLLKSSQNSCSFTDINFREWAKKVFPQLSFRKCRITPDMSPLQISPLFSLCKLYNPDNLFLQTEHSCCM